MATNFRLLALVSRHTVHALRRKWRRSGPQQVIFNLALSMLLAWLVFLVGFERVHPPLVCMLVAGLLHYLILVTFVWMMVEGVVQYMMVIKVTGNNFNNFMGKTAFPAWGESRSFFNRRAR